MERNRRFAAFRTMHGYIEEKHTGQMDIRDIGIIKSLFPWYLFFISEYPDELEKLLKKILGFAQLLGDDDDPIPLYPQEEEFLRKYTNADKVVEMSYGYILGERIIVTDGPMKDYQGKIVHIDRHKRKAVLEVEFFGRRTEVTVGLEIVKKG